MIDLKSTSTPPAPPVAGDPGMRTLLVVDDELAPRMAIRMIFEQEYRVLQAADGFEALDLLEAEKVHVATLDLRMPGMNGIEVLEQIKNRFPEVEVVILTAYESVETAKQALRLGACDYLNKPIGVVALKEAVAKAMQKNAISEQLRGVGSKLDQLQNSISACRLSEEMMRMRGEIYASIIHDLNGPLTVIASFAETITRQLENAQRLGTSDWDNMRERMRRVHRQAGNCVRISRRYLGFLREGGERDNSVSLNQTLADLRDLLPETSHARENELVVQPLTRDVEVLMHGTDLLQVLLNLGINAFQASDLPHRVAITAELVPPPNAPADSRQSDEEKWISKHLDAGQIPMVALKVHDEAGGIAPEVLRTIFASQFTTKPRGTGTGLGLLIVQRLVLEAGGCIHVRTRLGIGTCFTVYLPIRVASGEDVASGAGVD